MHDAVQVTQHGPPQAHVLHQPGSSRQAHHVALRVLVVQKDEQAADDVLHQALRTKAYGQTDDARARQQCPDVNTRERQERQQAHKQHNKAT